MGKTDGALRAGELGQQSELDVIGNVRRVRGGPQIPGFLQRHTDLGGYKYTAFGKLLPPDAGTPLPDWGFFGVQPLDQPLRWQGRWFVDVAGGIYDFRNRWWSPELGITVKSRLERIASDPAGPGVRQSDLLRANLKR